jgi:hypothetical protein
VGSGEGLAVFMRGEAPATTASKNHQNTGPNKHPTGRRRKSPLPDRLPDSQDSSIVLNGRRMLMALRCVDSV